MGTVDQRSASEYSEGNGSVRKITGKHMGILWGLEGMWFHVECKPSILAC